MVIMIGYYCIRGLQTVSSRDPILLSSSSSLNIVTLKYHSVIIVKYHACAHVGVNIFIFPNNSYEFSVF